MNQQHGSRWSLDRTRNRVLLALAVGIVVDVLTGLAGLDSSLRVVLFLVIVPLTYALVTVFRRRARTQAGADSNR